MYDLFIANTSEHSLEKALEKLTEDDIFDISSERIFYRGEDYYNSGNVRDAWFADKHHLEARVTGYEEYKIQISLENETLTASCSCPFDGVCKHMIAVLIYATLEDIETRKPMIEIHPDSWREWLKNLPKSELIDLVDKFATKDFRNKVQNQFLTDDKSLDLISKVDKKIDQLFEDEELLWEPGDMEAALANQISKIDGLGSKHPEEFFAVIVKIVEKSDDAQDQGYLYNSYHDDIFDGTFLIGFVHSFIKTLPVRQKVYKLNELKDIVSQISYDSFPGMFDNLHQLFPEKEYLPLKVIILENIKEEEYTNFTRYFEIVKPILNDEELTHILSKVFHLNSKLAIYAAEHYEKHGQIDLSIRALETQRSPQGYWEGMTEVYSKLLQLKHSNDTLDQAFAEEMLLALPFKKTLKDIIACLPDLKRIFEKKLHRNSPSEYLKYLEEENRLEEALAVVLNNGMIWEEGQYTFFRKYKKEFPKQAKAYFIKRIDENLQYTGDEYYHKVADALKSLQAVDPQEAKDITAKIRREYKRRRNLMKLL